MSEHEEILKEITGSKIEQAWHKVEGRIDNFIELVLDNGKTLVFYAENSEYALSLNF